MEVDTYYEDKLPKPDEDQLALDMNSGNIYLDEKYLETNNAGIPVALDDNIETEAIVEEENNSYEDNHSDEEEEEYEEVKEKTRHEDLEVIETDMESLCDRFIKECIFMHAIKSNPDRLFRIRSKIINISKSLNQPIIFDCKKYPFATQITNVTLTRTCPWKILLSLGKSFEEPTKIIELEMTIKQKFFESGFLLGMILSSEIGDVDIFNCSMKLKVKYEMVQKIPEVLENIEEKPPCDLYTEEKSNDEPEILDLNYPEIDYWFETTEPMPKNGGVMQVSQENMFYIDKSQEYVTIIFIDPRERNELRDEWMKLISIELNKFAEDY